jgi:hypothetical protein
MTKTMVVAAVPTTEALRRLVEQRGAEREEVAVREREAGAQRAVRAAAA